MPTDLIDVPTFTTPVVIQADGDPLNTASISDAFQALANRTRALQAAMVATLLQDAGQILDPPLSQPAAQPDALVYDGSFFYATGINFNGSVIRSEDGIRNWRVPTTAVGTATMDVLAADGAGVVLAGGIDGEVIRSTDSGDVWAVTSAPNVLTTDDLVAMVWNPTIALFILISSTNEIWTSPSGAAASFTLRTTPGGISALNGRIAIATSGANVGRMFMAQGSGGIWSDDGITWTSVNAGASLDMVVAGWSDHDGGYFLAGNNDGDVFRSAEAGSWSTVSVDVGPTVGGTAADVFRIDMVSDAVTGVWVALMTLTGAGAKDTYVYSADDGVTWSAAPYDRPGEEFLSAMFALGRFYLGSSTSAGSQLFTTSVIA